MNLPNKLTILRILMIPVFVAIFYITAIPFNFIISAVIFALASLTDFLDGHIARKYNMVTDFGKFLDPIADKVLVSTALIVMIVPPIGTTMLPWYSGIGVAIIMARELIISGFRLVAAGKGLVIAADFSGKLKTFVTDIAILVILVTGDIIKLVPSISNLLLIVNTVLLGVSVLLTIISGVECLVKNKKVISSK